MKSVMSSAGQVVASAQIEPARASMYALLSAPRQVDVSVWLAIVMSYAHHRI
jgi:hypothetical protein